MLIKTKRIYEPFAQADGYRVLVDRLWPRGIKKEVAHIDEWLKEVAPSAILRKWFNHEPEKWEVFRSRYRTELKETPAFETLTIIVREHKVVTLLYAAREERYNQAEALKQLITAV